MSKAKNNKKDAEAVKLDPIIEWYKQQDAQSKENSEKAKKDDFKAPFDPDVLLEVRMCRSSICRIASTQ